MEGLDCDLLKQELVYRPVGTVLFSGGFIVQLTTASNKRLSSSIRIFFVYSRIMFSSMAESGFWSKINSGHKDALQCMYKLPPTWGGRTQYI